VTTPHPLYLELDHVDVRFGERLVLDGVSLAVHAGEIVTIIGPNGAGKTTLLRTVLGLQAATHGTLRRKPDLRIGYVPQRVAIDDTMPLTVRRFLALARASRAEIAAALAEVGAEHAIDLAVQTLSGGEMQRVLLARALLRRPDLLVLDEPVQGVDVAGQAEIFALIRRIRDRYGCAVLLVSHDLHLVMAATDRVVCLDHHICCSGTPETVTRHPEYLSLFGATVEGIAPYTHHHDHRHDHQHHHGHERGNEHAAPDAERPVEAPLVDEARHG
jgi:zinc transport system ATP-binding protein